MNHNAVSVRLIGRVLGRCDEFFHVWAQLWGDHCDTGTTTMQHPGPACSDRAAAHNKDGAPGESHTKRKNVRHDDLARSNLDRVLRRTGGGINFCFECVTYHSCGKGVSACWINNEERANVARVQIIFHSKISSHPECDMANVIEGE